mmetsp:Transcript_12021/g.26940  ORF Transcript_12021/g.26940 Transcript_12021/m.26940 type:complete len:282 (+) Transcript_12021:906-1751(+)
MHAAEMQRASAPGKQRSRGLHRHLPASVLPIEASRGRHKMRSPRHPAPVQEGSSHPPPHPHSPHPLRSPRVYPPRPLLLSPARPLPDPPRPPKPPPQPLPHSPPPPPLPPPPPPLRHLPLPQRPQYPHRQLPPPQPPPLPVRFVAAFYRACYSSLGLLALSSSALASPLASWLWPSAPSPSFPSRSSPWPLSLSASSASRALHALSSASPPPTWQPFASWPAPFPCAPSPPLPPLPSLLLCAAPSLCWAPPHHCSQSCQRRKRTEARGWLWRRLLHHAIGC